MTHWAFNTVYASHLPYFTLYGSCVGNRRLHVRRKVFGRADLSLSADMMLCGYILRQAEIKGSHLKWQVFRKLSHAESTSSSTFYVISRSFLKHPCQRTSGERVANRFGRKTLNVVLSWLTKQLNTKTYPKRIVVFVSKTLQGSSLTFQHTVCIMSFIPKGKKRSIFASYLVLHHILWFTTKRTSRAQN